MTSVDVVFDLDHMSRHAVRDAVEHDRTSKFRHVAFVSSGTRTIKPKKVSVLLEPDTISLLRQAAFLDARGANFSSFLQGLTASWLQEHKDMGLPAALLQQPALEQVLGALKKGGEPDLWVFTTKRHAIPHISGYDRVLVFEPSCAKPAVLVDSPADFEGEDTDGSVDDSESSLSASDADEGNSLIADLVADPDMRASVWNVMSGALGTSGYVH